MTQGKVVGQSCGEDGTQTVITSIRKCDDRYQIIKLASTPLIFFWRMAFCSSL